MIGSDDVFIPKLKALIDENMADPSFSVDTICRQLGISRAQLHRIVQEQFKLPVALYIRKVRMEKANYLLVHTDLRISEIADRVGINNPQNFSKYFAYEFKISPTEFRRLRQDPTQEAESSTSTVSSLSASAPPPEATPVFLQKNSRSRSAGNFNKRWIFYGLILIGLIIFLILYFSPYL